MFILLSLPTSVVLTMDQSCYTTLVEQNTQSELILSGLGPSGVDPIVFDKFYDDAFNYTELFNVPYMWPFSGQIQPAGADHSLAVDNKQVYVGVDGVLYTQQGSHALSGLALHFEWDWVQGENPYMCYWRDMTRNVGEYWWVARKWQIFMRRSGVRHEPDICLAGVFWRTLPGFMAGYPLFHVCMLAFCIGTCVWGVFVTPVRRLVRGFHSVLTLHGVNTRGRKVRVMLFWLVALGNMGLCDGVCQICHGFYAGCDGGGNGRTCKEAAQVAANVTAVAVATGAISLVGLFNTRILRVFTATVLGLVSRYKSMPVAGTPYDFDGKTNNEVVADVTAGKVSKTEALVHFSKKIEEAAALGEDAGRVSKTLALEVQIKLLGAMDDKAASSSSNTPLIGVHRFVWAKCTEVVMAKDNSKVAVGGTEKESTTAQTAKIITPDCVEAFFEILNLWQAIVVQTGLAPLMVVFEFTQRVVFLPMRRGDSWKLAHELLLVYLDKVDQAVDKSKTLSNVFDKEGVDAMKDEALAGVVSRFGSGPANIFRHTGGSRGQGGDKEYNGRDTPRAAQPCIAWNRNPNDPQHRQEHLFDDGCCRFRHKCGMFIKLPNGEVGYCFRNHCMSNCDRKPEERSDVGPAKKRV